MIKNYTVLIFCILNFNGIIAQTPELVVNVNSPGKIAIHGNDLFIAQQEDNKISKNNLLDTNPNLIDFITDTKPLDIRIDDNFMYVAELNSGSFNDKIYQIDIVNSSSTTTELIVGSELNGIAIKSNDLFVMDYGVPSVIFRIDVPSITSPTSIEFTPIFNNNIIFETYNMFIHNNILYLSQTDPDLIAIRVSKLNLDASQSTQPTPVFTGFNSIPRSFAIKDNYLYVALHDKISKIDLTEATPTPSVVTTEVNNPQGLVIKDCDLYISEKSSNKITKLNLCTLSTENNSLTKSISLSPNPSKNQIKISGLTELKNYKIFNTLGIEVNDGIISNNENINIQNLVSGVYFLKFQNGNTLKFIKE